METIPPDSKQKIVEVLKEKRVVLPCPRCANNNFTLADGYFNNTIQQDLKGGFVIGGPSIPSIVVVCNNCGFLSQHALGVLGLLPAEEVSNEKK